MKIVFVINNYFAVGNGMSASVRRTTAVLRSMGHEVRIVSGPNHTGNGAQAEYPLKDLHVPIFQPLIDANGYEYAQPDMKVLEEAAKWADVVNLTDPFTLAVKAIKACEKVGTPITATYHIHPENVSFAFGPLLYWKGFNRAYLKLWEKAVYNHCSYIQCPSQNVKDRLLRHHFKAGLKLISNGLVMEECTRHATPWADYEDPDRPIRVLCIGRLSVEKDQFTLLNAMKYCKNAHRIQLQFAGHGLKEEEIKKQAHKLYTDGVLKYAPEFHFLDKQGLIDIAAKADMAIHCAFIEVEGLSIMEAMQQGAMPIIAESRISGTSQFALSRRNIFPAKNPEALAARIDYWIAHPKERWESGLRHAESMKQYDINKSVEKMVKMFQAAIDKHKK